jgi:hypothetical protein
MQGVVEVSSGERHGKRKPETRLVQLIDRNDYERPRLSLLSPSSRIGVGPINLTLARTRLYHSGADASKSDSIASLSAR